MLLEERNFSNLDLACKTLATELASILREAIRDRGRAVLAVSGGSTPEFVFKYLCNEDLDWSCVVITLTDERWVPSDHPDSNENLVRCFLLKGLAKAANFIPMYVAENFLEKGQVTCEKRLSEIPQPFDAVYLGMGEDGHFASLFPQDEAINVRNSKCVAVPSSDSRQARMSLTVPVILAARKIFLLFSGVDKLKKYAEAKQEGSYDDVPIRLVLNQENTPVSVLISK